MKNRNQIDKKIEEIYAAWDACLHCFELSDDNLKELKYRYLGAISALNWVKSHHKHIDWKE